MTQLNVTLFSSSATAISKFFPLRPWQTSGGCWNSLSENLANNYIENQYSFMPRPAVFDVIAC